MKQIKLALTLAGITAAFGLAACQIVASPMAGTTFNETKYGNIATEESAANKEGKACGTSILGAFAQGDASIVAAKANGGITKVSSVDHYAKNILGIFGEWCTIVKGS
ncbi:MAG TPA: TRL-like family protein [Nitrospiraceae bacterium]|nr:TRL-like family protein [Nitrospiraceae bacterium]